MSRIYIPLPEEYIPDNPKHFRSSSASDRSLSATIENLVSQIKSSDDVHTFEQTSLSRRVAVGVADAFIRRGWVVLISGHVPTQTYSVFVSYPHVVLKHEGGAS